MAALEHLVIIWISVLVAAFLARKTRLTPVLYFLAAGAVLVNTGALPHESEPFIRGFAEVGIILIMFALGFEENSSAFVKSVKRSWGIALFGALAPFSVAYGLTFKFWGDAQVALICGLAMTATAVSLTMVSLRSEGLQRSAAATGIMTSAVLDDIASLAAIAIVVPIALGETTTDPQAIALITAKALLFFVMVTLLGGWLFPHPRRGPAQNLPGLRHLLRFAGGEYAMLTVLIIALLVGLIAHWFGFHPAVGAYMAGLILKDEYFPSEDVGDPEGNFGYQHNKQILDSVAFSWIGPVFFVELGTKLVLDGDLVLAVLPETALLTVSLLVAQITSAGLAARYTGGFAPAESLLIGVGMLGRAELAFVVMDIAYVQNPLLTDEAFYTLMFTAFWLNVAVPVSIAAWKRVFGAEQAPRAPT